MSSFLILSFGLLVSSSSSFFFSLVVSFSLTKISCWDDMEVPEESFHWSSWDSRTCYPRRAFIQGLTDDQENERRDGRWNRCILDLSPQLPSTHHQLWIGKHTLRFPWHISGSRINKQWTLTKGRGPVHCLFVDSWSRPWERECVSEARVDGVRKTVSG